MKSSVKSIGRKRKHEHERILRRHDIPVVKYKFDDALDVVHN